MVCGKLPTLTVTQAHFCAVMAERRRARKSALRNRELAMKFLCSMRTIHNAVSRKYTKHYRHAERA